MVTFLLCLDGSDLLHDQVKVLLSSSTKKKQLDIEVSLPATDSQTWSSQLVHAASD